jgi:type IV pilus assembly protein PilW
MTKRYYQAGLSMIELMIAMVIGLILTAAVLQVFVGSRVTYSMQSGLAKLQENGRFATQYLSRDLRKAGFMGCSTNNSLANTVIDDGSDVWDFIDFSNVLSGEDNVDGTASYGTADPRSPLVGTDVVIIKYADSDGGCTVEDHNPTAASVRCELPHAFQKGDVLIVSDCSHTAVFQQSNTNNNATTATVVHNTGNATPGNCTKGLGLPVLCGTANGTAYTFPPGASVLQLRAYRFFVANNDYGEPSLYRQSSSNSSGTLGFAEPIELVEGVEDLQISYGEDTGSDSKPDRYVVAGTVSDFDDVVAVRINLLIQSNEENIVQGGQSLQFNGATVNLNDGRLRKVFTTTIAIRNRL